MKKFNFLSLFFAGLLLFFSFSAVRAQDEMPSSDAPNKQIDRRQRPNLLAELGLSPEQRQQIRRINAAKKSIVRQAQQRLREANDNFDRAVYSDNLTDPEIQARLRDVQTAHAELIKIRLTNELAVRRILTAEQLAKFRDLRAQFAQSMENNRDQPRKNSLQNLQNFKQRLKLPRNQMRPND